MGNNCFASILGHLVEVVVGNYLNLDCMFVVGKAAVDMAVVAGMAVVGRAVAGKAAVDMAVDSCIENYFSHPSSS